MEKEKKLYTLLVYSENIAGILNQITAVFTRRQVNIESLNVSASSIEGVHKPGRQKPGSRSSFSIRRSVRKT